MSALRVFRQGLRVGYSDFLDFWHIRSWLFAWMLRILSNAFAWVLLGRLLQSEDAQSYLLVGNSVAIGATSALWASSATTWSRYDGTHTLNIIAPSSLVPAMIGRTSIWLMNGIATSVTAFLILKFAFDFHPRISSTIIALPILVLVCASVFFFALVLGSLIGRHVRLRNLVLDISSTLFVAFCGVNVPTSFWPFPIQQLASVMPLTHGLAAIRALFANASAGQVLREVGIQTLVGAGWFVLALLLMDHLAEKVARRVRPS